MNRSQRLHLSDMRAVFRLLGEIRELGADPLTWRRHMLESLNRIIGAQVGVCGEALYRSDVSLVAPATMVDVGGPGIRDWSAFTSFVASPEALRCPVFSAMTRRRAVGHTGVYGPGKPFPPFDARAWRRSLLVEQLRTAGIEKCIYSQHAVPFSPACQIMSLHRAPREAHFNRADVWLVRVFHEELSRLWRPPCANRWSGLAPRLRQTLDRLLAGRSEKQIARELDLSPHTVHNYLKELHRRFGVASRGELLAACAAAHRPDFFPRLSTRSMAI